MQKKRKNSHGSPRSKGLRKQTANDPCTHLHKQMMMGKEEWGDSAGSPAFRESLGCPSQSLPNENFIQGTTKKSEFEDEAENQDQMQELPEAMPVPVRRRKKKKSVEQQLGSLSARNLKKRSDSEALVQAPRRRSAKLVPRRKMMDDSPRQPSHHSHPTNGETTPSPRKLRRIEDDMPLVRANASIHLKKRFWQSSKLLFLDIAVADREYQWGEPVEIRIHLVNETGHEFQVFKVFLSPASARPQDSKTNNKKKQQKQGLGLKEDVLNLKCFTPALKNQVKLPNKWGGSVHYALPTVFADEHPPELHTLVVEALIDRPTPPNSLRANVPLSVFV